MKNSYYHLVLAIAILFLMFILTSCNSMPPSKKSEPATQGNSISPLPTLTMEAQDNSAPISTATSLPSPISTPSPVATPMPLPSSTPFPPAIIAETVTSNTVFDAQNVEVIGYAKIGAARGVAIQEGYAYIAAGNAGSGLPVVDLSRVVQTNVTRGRRVPGLAMPLYGGGSTNSVAVSGTYAYLGDSFGLRVMDISNPAVPMSVYQESISDVQDLQVIGNLVYVAGAAGMYIFDASNPRNLMLLSHNEIIGANGIAVEGPFAYIAGIDGLRVVDIANATNPVEVGRYLLPALAWDVVVGDGSVYVSWNWRGSQRQGCKECDSGVRIFAVTAEGKLAETGNYRMQGDTVAGLAVEGEHMYVAAGEKGLRVVDVSNPDHLTEVGYFNAPSNANAVTVVDNLVYIADGGEGLWILKDTSSSKKR